MLRNYRVTAVEAPLLSTADLSPETSTYLEESIFGDIERYWQEE